MVDFSLARDVFIKTYLNDVKTTELVNKFNDKKRKSFDTKMFKNIDRDCKRFRSLKARSNRRKSKLRSF